MVAEGKISPAQLEQMKQKMEKGSPEMKAKMGKKKKHPPH